MFLVFLSGFGGSDKKMSLPDLLLLNPHAAAYLWNRKKMKIVEKIAVFRPYFATYAVTAVLHSTFRCCRD